MLISFWQVVSKGVVIHEATEAHPHPTKFQGTFSVPVSSEMAPTFKLVAMVVSPVGEPGTNGRYPTQICVGYCHFKATVQQQVTRTSPGAFVAVSILRHVNFIFKRIMNKRPVECSKRFTSWNHLYKVFIVSSNQFQLILTCWTLLLGLFTEWLGRITKD